MQYQGSASDTGAKIRRMFKVEVIFAFINAASSHFRCTLPSIRQVQRIVKCQGVTRRREESSLVHIEAAIKVRVHEIIGFHKLVHDFKRP